MFKQPLIKIKLISLRFAYLSRPQTLDIRRHYVRKCIVHLVYDNHIWLKTSLNVYVNKLINAGTNL